jgi:hypothetical protein
VAGTLGEPPTRSRQNHYSTRNNSEQWRFLTRRASVGLTPGGDDDPAGLPRRAAWPGKRALLKGEVPSESLVLILDSLVLKFEAILRKLARLLGVPHLKATTGQHPLTEVAGLELLDSERIVEICGDDLIAYAKYTLDREPEGLRDRIGHAILHRAEYKLADLQAVVQLVLRFAALQLPKTDKEQGSSTRAGGSAAT